MSEAFIGLAGAVLGAVVALLGSVLSERRQRAHEAMQWRRDQRAAAYEGAFRHVLRAANRRRMLSPFEGASLGKEGEERWVDDFVEAQFWLRTLISRCHAEQASRLQPAVEKLEQCIREDKTYYRMLEALDESVQIVADCAREDLGVAPLPSTDPRSATR